LTLLYNIILKHAHIAVCYEMFQYVYNNVTTVQHLPAHCITTSAFSWANIIWGASFSSSDSLVYTCSNAEQNIVQP